MVAPMSLPVGVTLPNYGPLAAAATLSRLARRAEELGFDSIWVADHLVMPCDVASIYPFDRRARPQPARLDGLVEFYEPVVTLAYIAAVTTRIRLGVSVYIVPYRNPVVTAKLIATLDALSNGRVIFGAGVGWLREEFHALGADPRQRGRVTDEYLEVCRRLWRDEVASFSGAHYQLPAVRTGPKPTQRPWPPIWIGGNSQAALTRAVALGDGLHLIDLSPDDAAAVGAQLTRRLHEAGRARTSVTLSLRTGVSVHGDAQAHDAAWTPETLRRDRDAYARAGIDYFIVALRGAGTVEQLEAAFTEIAAALHG
jgi:probable F420-dependent oxidoreductase